MNSIYESYTIPEIQCVLAALFNGFQQYDQNGTKPYSVLIGPRLLITSLVNDRGCYIKHSQHFWPMYIAYYRPRENHWNDYSHDFRVSVDLMICE